MPNKLNNFKSGSVFKKGGVRLEGGFFKKEGGRGGVNKLKNFKVRNKPFYRERKVLLS